MGFKVAMKTESTSESTTSRDQDDTTGDAIKTMSWQNKFQMNF